MLQKWGYQRLPSVSQCYTLHTFQYLKKTDTSMFYGSYKSGSTVIM